MKKLTVPLLASALLLSLAACGGGTTSTTPTPEPASGQTVTASAIPAPALTSTLPATSVESETEEKSVEDILISTVWIDYYDGRELSFTKDGTAAWGNSSCTWMLNGNMVTIEEALPSEIYEYYLDVLEDDTGDTFLQLRESGKWNGNIIGWPTSEFYSDKDIQRVRASRVKNPGEAVTTDIIELTVKKAALSYYASSPSWSSESGIIENIDEACEPTDDTGFFTTSKGRSLVCLNFVVTNNDRSTLDLDTEAVSFFITQNGKMWFVNGYELNSKNGSPLGLRYSWSPVSKNGGPFFNHTSSNILIEPGESVEIKVIGVVGFEPDNLSDPFDLTANVKNSDGKDEMFLYAFN